MDQTQTGFHFETSSYIIGLQSLSCNKLVIEKELYFQVLKSYINFPIWVGKICKEGKVTVEILWCVEVDDGEACIRSVKHRASRFNDKEDDQSCNSKEDENKTEYEAQDCTAPY